MSKVTTKAEKQACSPARKNQSAGRFLIWQIGGSACVGIIRRIG